MNKISFLKKIDSAVGPLLARLFPQCPMPANSLTDIQQILFIRPGGIGDAVLLIPAIQVLRLRYPHAKIEVLAEKRNAVIFELCPQVDKIFCYDRWRDWKRLFCSSYDLIIDTEQWHYLSAVIARLLRAPVRLGFATNARSKLFTHPVSYSHDDYEVFSFYHLLHPLGTVCSRELNSPFLTVPEAVKSATELLDSVSEGYVVLFPGASIQERRWGERKFVALAEKIAALGFPLVIVGGDDDLTVGEAVEKNVVSAKNMAGKTSLLETASILRGATLLISGDSGVLHMAVGLGIRTVSLFGPGIAKKWAPSGHRHTVINHHLPCSPCTRFGTTPPCPIGAKCLQDMTVDEVFTAAETLLHSHA